MTPEYKELIRSRAEYQEDGDFVVNARRFIHDLLDYVEELEAKLEKVKKNTKVLRNTKVLSKYDLDGFSRIPANEMRNHIRRQAIFEIAQTIYDWHLYHGRVWHDENGEFFQATIYLRNPDQVYPQDLPEGANDE